MAGFTILETMVALIIAAMLLAVLHGLFDNEIGALGGAQAEAHAILLAQSRLETLGVSRPLLAGVSRGQTQDGYAWSEEVVPDAAPASPQPGHTAVIPVAVKETVSWQEGANTHALSLDSVRLEVQR